MFDPAEPRLFGVAPGVDFPRAVVDGLTQRLRDQPPEAWARVTIYVNSARMRDRLRAVLQQGPPRLLPRLRLVTEIGRGNVTVPAEMPKLHVRLQLSQLVARLLDQDPSIAPRAAIYDLSDSLAALMEEMHTEGVTPADLAALDMAEHSAHWQRSLRVLAIITDYFGEDASAVSGAEARLRRVVLSLAEIWKTHPPSDPIIVAGSTGSRGATRLFMSLVAQLPNGAVVLPGFDLDQPDHVWAHLADAMTAEDHPQFRFQALADTLLLPPSDIRAWSALPPPNAARNQLVSLALRPAPVTDQWRSEGAALTDSLPQATGTLTLIQAPSRRVEANAIALCLRKAAAEGKVAALISPDRVLTRQVTAALDRWSLVPDDSAGTPLNQTPPGRLLRHVLTALLGPLALDQCLILMKHPLFDSIKARGGQHRLWTRDLELYWRKNACAFPQPADVEHWLRTSPADPAKRVWADWIVAHLLHPRDTADRSLADHLTRHIALTETLAGGPDGGGLDELWKGEPGVEAQKAVIALTEAAPHGGEMSVHDYAAFFSAYLADQVVTIPTLAHPGIKIWGTLEARVGGADLMILAGLNDGTWPELPGPDPWLNRQMRKQAGLLLPERRVGLHAHDFQQAIGAQHVVLSRSLKVDETEAVPSRWINRLGNLLNGLGETGKACYDQMVRRGQGWIDLAAALEHPVAKLPPAPRPSPSPPLHSRPKVLSVTTITRLIRDPYAIYASRILDLHPLEPLNPTADARMRGDLLHSALRRVIREGQALPQDHDMAEQALRAAFQAELETQIPWPAMAALWRARFGTVLPGLLVRERARAEQGVPVLTEQKHGIALTGMDITLTAKPDRIDRLKDGSFAVLDYKTTPPTAKQVLAFDKQLPLEAAMLERGAFPTLGTGHVSDMTYIGLGSSGNDVTIPMEVKDSEGRLPDLTWQGLHHLMRAYARLDKGYTARRANQRTLFAGDYDHLSRHGEWSEVDAPVFMELSDD